MQEELLDLIGYYGNKCYEHGIVNYVHVYPGRDQNSENLKKEREEIMNKIKTILNKKGEPMKNIEFTHEELVCLLAALVIVKEEEISGEVLKSAAKKIIKAVKGVAEKPV